MSISVFCPVPSLPYTVKGLLSSITVFKQDKVPVHITGLSPPDRLTCHSASVMKAFTFCLKVGDERGAAGRDLLALTDQIKEPDAGERGTRDKRRGWGCSCLNWLGSEVKGKVYMKQESVALCTWGWMVLPRGCGDLFILETRVSGLVAICVSQ